MRPIAFGAAALLLNALGCAHPAEQENSYQGVVEYEVRELGFESSGRVQALLVERGQLLEDGALLAKLDSTLEELTREVQEHAMNAAQAELSLLLSGTRREDVAEAAAQLESAISQERLAEKSATRARALFEKKALSSEELDRAEAEHQLTTAGRQRSEEHLRGLRRGARSEEIVRAQARVAQARASLELETERLRRFELKITGPAQVLDVHLRPGELAAAGAPVLSVADTQHPYAYVFVPQAEIGGLKIGTGTTLTSDSGENFPALKLHGKVEYFSPRTEFTPRFLFSERERPHLVVRVRVRIEDGDRSLRSGVPVFAQFER